MPFIKKTRARGRKNTLGRSTGRKTTRTCRWSYCSGFLIASFVAFDMIRMLYYYSSNAHLDIKLDSLLESSKHSFFQGTEVLQTNSQKNRNLVEYPNLLCRDIFSRVRNETDTVFIDPNEGQIYKRYMNRTGPEFWISVHNKKFDFVRWSLMTYGQYYETGIVQNMHGLLKAKPQGLFIDVGMNIGYYSLLARALGHDVVGFDPIPANMFRLCQSLELNGWNEGVKIFPYGIGESSQEMKIEWSGRNPGAATFDEVTNRRDKRFHCHECFAMVKMVTLDTMALQEKWTETNSKPINILKVDVEGFEPYVFLGAKNLLQSGKIENIFMEFSPRENIDLFVEMLETISSSGYKIFMIANWKGRNVSHLYSTSNMTLLTTSFMKQNHDGNLWWIKE